jgi:acyl carrier protein
MREDLVAKLRKIIVNDLFVEIAENDIGLDDGLRTVVGLDSVGFVELRVLCEQRFNVEINDNDYTPENFTSIRLLATLIDRLQGRGIGANARQLRLCSPRLRVADSEKFTVRQPQKNCRLALKRRGGGNTLP